jgi:predicted transporter
MIFQKGFAGFISINGMSVGLAVGFDNFLDKNRSSWIYNQKAYLGLIISVSGF